MGQVFSEHARVLDDAGEKVELSMQLGNLEEMKLLVLSWGRDARVIKPKKLRDAVKKEAAAVAQNYRK